MSLWSLGCVLDLEGVAHAATLDGVALEEKQRHRTEEGKGEGRGQGRRDTRQVTATSGAAAEAEADPGR